MSRVHPLLLCLFLPLLAACVVQNPAASTGDDDDDDEPTPIDYPTLDLSTASLFEQIWDLDNGETNQLTYDVRLFRYNLDPDSTALLGVFSGGPEGIQQLPSNPGFEDVQSVPTDPQTYEFEVMPLTEGALLAVLSTLGRYYVVEVTSLTHEDMTTVSYGSFRYREIQ